MMCYSSPISLQGCQVLIYLSPPSTSHIDTKRQQTRVETCSYIPSHISIDFSHGTFAFTDLQDISNRAVTVSVLKWVIKTSLIIQISHTVFLKWCVKVASRTKWQIAFKLVKRRKNKLLTVPVYFNLILHVVWIAFSSIVEFVNGNRGQCLLHIECMKLQ